MIKPEQISEVTWKHLKVIAFLLGSWGISLGLVYITDDPKLVGLAPVLNLLAVIIQKELAEEGYIRHAKK